MLKRVLVFVVLGMFALYLTACGAAEDANQSAESEPAPAETQKPAEEAVPVYELTKDEITSHPDWTSRNISVLGVKIGDRTREVEKNLGDVENTRTLPEDYLTIYQGNGLFVYTFKITGRARRIEVNQAFAKKVADAKLQKLLASGDLKTMRDVLGMEEGDPIENTEDNSIEYSYDSRGFRFVRFKVGGQTLNALRFMEMKRST